MAKIGLLSMMFARGQSEVSLTLAQALTDLGHEIHWLIREGGVYGQPMRACTGRYALANRTDYPTYDVPPAALVGWARHYGLDAVLFNEELDLSLPHACQQVGIKTLTYIDAFIGPTWRPFLRWYDQIWCVTQRSYDVLAGWKQEARLHKIGWGVRPDAFAARESCEDTQRPYALMSSQGWLGVGLRKGLDPLLAALDLMDDPPSTLIHAQVPVEVALQLTQRVALPACVTWRDDDVPPPGLYHLGRVVCQPSKIEGFGLSVVEALCAGRPIITTDAPPMHAFVTDTCGWLVPVDHWQPHPDGSVYQQALIDPHQLATTIQEACQMPHSAIWYKAERALERARYLFNWSAFTQRLAAGLAKVGIV